MKKSILIISVIVVLSMITSITAFGGNDFEAEKVTLSVDQNLDNDFEMESQTLPTATPITSTTKPTTVAKISISKCSISNIVSKTYSGKARTQAPKVKYSGKTLKLGTDYKLSYKNNKNVGTATVTITGIGKYKNSVSKTFKINPKSTAISKVTTPKSKQLKVTWKKNSTQTTGYQIKISTSKSFSKNNKSYTISSNKTTSKTISKLKSKKTYYVKVRTYKVVNKTKYYSSWSSVKSIKVK